MGAIVSISCGIVIAAFACRGRPMSMVCRPRGNGIRGANAAKERERRTYLWKVALAVADQETRLAAAAVANDDNLLGVGRCFRVVRPRRFSTRRAAHDCADCAFTGARVALRCAPARRRPAGNVVLLVVSVVGIAILVVRHGWRATSKGCLAMIDLLEMLRWNGRIPVGYGLCVDGVGDMLVNWSWPRGCRKGVFTARNVVYDFPAGAG